MRKRAFLAIFVMSLYYVFFNDRNMYARMSTHTKYTGDDLLTTIFSFQFLNFLKQNFFRLSLTHLENFCFFFKITFAKQNVIYFFMSSDVYFDAKNNNHSSSYLWTNYLFTLTLSNYSCFSTKHE